MDYFVQISFVAEWSTVLENKIYCLLYKDVNMEQAREILEGWSEVFVGVEVGSCMYSFYDNNSDIVVLSQTDEYANKRIKEVYDKLSIEPYYISNYKTDLSRGKRVKFLQLDWEGQITISLDQEHYSNETTERTKEKWNSLLNYDHPTLTLVKGMLAEKSIFESPLLKRLIFVKDRWMELLSSEELWSSLFELYELALNRNERIIELLPILKFLETNVNKTRHVLLVKYKKINDDMKNMKTRHFNDFLIETCDNNMFMFIKTLGDVKSVIKILKKYPRSLQRMVSAYEINFDNVVLEWNIPNVPLAREDIFPVIDGIVLQLQDFAKSCDHYCNTFLKTFKKNETILIDNGYSLEERGENFVQLVQTPLARKLILVPMKPFELAQLAHTESGLLREVVGTYENKTCEELYNMLGIRDFRYAYYRAKWDIAKNYKARNILMQFPKDSIWMRDITWIGEKWHEVAEKEEAWNKLLDLYLKVKIKPLDQTDDYYGVEIAERQNLTD